MRSVTGCASPSTTTMPLWLTSTPMPIPSVDSMMRFAGSVSWRLPRIRAMTRSGNGAAPDALPVPSSQLDRYRLRLRQRDRGTVAGAHLIRQRGQSLDFREFRPYLPGDDIRHVD